MTSSMQTFDISYIDLNNTLYLMELLSAKDTEDLNIPSLPSSSSSTSSLLVQHGTISPQTTYLTESLEYQNDSISLDNMDQFGSIQNNSDHQRYADEEELDMSLHSPCSSSPYPSPRTVYSNLSTPTGMACQLSGRFEDQATTRLMNVAEEDKLVHFSHPFSPSTSESSFNHLLNHLPYQAQQQSPYLYTLPRSNDTITPQQNSTNKTSLVENKQNFTSPSSIDDYFFTKQEFASKRIKDFDAFIATLSAQGKNEKKRTQSKTFEDILPYLSGTSTENSFESVRPPFLHKRAKTQMDLCNKNFDQNSKEEYLDWIPTNIVRKRQRSKTNATVYQMKNTPIVPFGSSFDSIKRDNLDITPISVETNFGSSFEGVQSTICKFVQQAARTALKGAKCTNEYEVSKRATAGSKARDEQNREKSKRYYDRKKAQSSAMSGLCSAIDSWYYKIGLPSPNELFIDNLAKQADNIASRSFVLPTERQKALKELSKMRESTQIRAIMSCAKKIKELIESQPETVVKQLIIRHSKLLENFAEIIPVRGSMTLDLDILETGLHIWLDFLHCWSDLILAEKRLSGKNNERPIFQLISTLTELL